MIFPDHPVLSAWIVAVLLYLVAGLIVTGICAKWLHDDPSMDLAQASRRYRAEHGTLLWAVVMTAVSVVQVVLWPVPAFAAIRAAWKRRRLA